MEVMRVISTIESPPPEAPLRKRGYEGMQIDSEIAAARARNSWGHQEQVRIEALRRELANSYDLNASTYAGIGFRRVLPEDVSATVTTNATLQKRLDGLCERLRARY
jgi:hypothetical protein